MAFCRLNTVLSFAWYLVRSKELEMVLIAQWAIFSLSWASLGCEVCWLSSFSPLRCQSPVRVCNLWIAVSSEVPNHRKEFCIGFVHFRCKRWLPYGINLAKSFSKPSQPKKAGWKRFQASWVWMCLVTLTFLGYSHNYFSHDALPILHIWMESHKESCGRGTTFAQIESKSDKF